MLRPFYDAVLPHAGHYCLFLGSTKTHVWVDSIDALVAATEERQQTQGLYFATASFHERGGRRRSNAMLRRSICLDIDAGEAKFAKHGDAVYETQAHALKALVAWMKDNAMPATYVVSSGAGLHVYYCLDRDLSVPEWQPLAEGVKSMALSHGLRIDPTVTGDAVRVLRPPGSVHPSGEVVRVLGTGKTYTPDTLAARVSAFMPKARPAKTNGGAKASLIEGIDQYIGPPRHLSKIVRDCPAMRHAVDLKGNVPEPYWRIMLGVIKFVHDGERLAHECSSGHPQYDPADTQAKFDRWATGPATCESFAVENPNACASCAYRGKVKSPIQLGSLTPEEIEQLGTPPQPAEPAPQEYLPGDGDDEDSGEGGAYGWEGCIPAGFKIKRDGDGFVMLAQMSVKSKNPQGEDVSQQLFQPFCRVPFWFESWAPGTSDGDPAHAVYCVYDPARKRTARYTMPTKSLALRNDFLGVLASQNVQVYPSTNLAKTAMEDYVKAAVERIRTVGQRPKITERFGTIFNAEGDLVVAQGVHLITKTGHVYEAVVSDKLRARSQVYRVPLPANPTAHWGPEVWNEYVLPRARRHIEYLNEFYSDANFRPYQLAIMLAWASPLLAFMQGNYYPGSPLPNIGLTVTLHSPKSGIGKTSAMHAAALAYGIPTGVCLQLDRNSSTSNARQAMLLQSGTMPGFMDEMEDVDPRDLAALVSAVGNGISKSRMRSDLSLQGGEQMALINLMSTNKSHRELIAADRTESSAVQMRLLEIECSGVTPVSAERAMQETIARSALNDCAGAVGAVIHYGMCMQGADALNKAGIECASKARELLGGAQDGRILWRAFGAVLLMRRILKVFGLKVFELDDLTAEFKRWHDRGYEFAEEQLLPTDTRLLLTMFLSDISGNILLTQNETHRGRINVDSPNVIDIPLNDYVPANVLGRAVLSGRYIYVKTDALRDWCAKRKVSYSQTVLNAVNMGLFEKQPGSLRKATRQIDLFKGTKYAQNVRPYVFKILVDNLDVEAFDHPAADNVVALVAPRADPQMPSSSASC
jgi:hypothetical protein